MRRAALLALLLACAPPLAARPAAAGSDPAALAAMAQDANVGVPGSPAFELLPEQPSEVVNAATPKDLAARLRTWSSGGRLWAGMALDARPLVQASGSMTRYRSSWLRRMALRTVLSAGTAVPTEGSRDVLFALGVRLPLVDRGDPRCDSSYQERMARAWDAAASAAGPPAFGASAADLAQRAESASVALDSLRQAFTGGHWNALKLDVGFAGSGTAREGRLNPDALMRNRGGVWAAAALPVGHVAELTVSGKAIWARTDSSTQESGRQAAGARLRVFPAQVLGLSLEAARVWSRCRGDAALNDSWTHLAGVLEWYIPELKSWVGVGYGGDLARNGNPGTRLEFHYAISKTRVMRP